MKKQLPTLLSLVLITSQIPVNFAEASAVPPAASAKKDYLFNRAIDAVEWKERLEGIYYRRRTPYDNWISFAPKTTTEVDCSAGAPNRVINGCQISLLPQLPDRNLKVDDIDSEEWRTALTQPFLQPTTRDEKECVVQLKNSDNVTVRLLKHVTNASKKKRPLEFSENASSKIVLCSFVIKTDRESEDVYDDFHSALTESANRGEFIDSPYELVLTKGEDISFVIEALLKMKGLKPGQKMPKAEAAVILGMLFAEQRVWSNRLDDYPPLARQTLYELIFDRIFKSSTTDDTATFSPKGYESGISLQRFFLYKL